MKTKPNTDTDVRIRWLIRRDLEEVLKIDADSFREPWGEEDYLTHLRQRNCIGMVAELPDDTIAGVMVYELHKSTLSLLRICVAPKHRGTGVGSTMVDRLRQKLQQQRRRVIYANVCEYNLAAQVWFSRRGFKASPNGDLIRFEWTLKGAFGPVTKIREE